MSEPTSRRALEEAVADIQPWVTARQRVAPNSAAMTARLAEAARAILDAPPVEWCDVHESVRWTEEHCIDNWKGDSGSCQFATYVRVKVAP